MTSVVEQIRSDHGMAQARAETALKDRVGHRYAHVSLTQGHRAGFWDGVAHVLTAQLDFHRLTAGEALHELRLGSESIYWPILADDPRIQVDCPACHGLTTITVEALCDECGHTFEEQE